MHIVNGQNLRTFSGINITSNKINKFQQAQRWLCSSLLFNSKHSNTLSYLRCNFFFLTHHFVGNKIDVLFYSAKHVVSKIHENQFT